MFVADFVQLARQLVESTDLPTILLSPLFPFSSQLHAPISNSTPSLFPSAHPLRPISDPSIKGTTSLSFLLYSLHLFLPLSLSRPILLSITSTFPLGKRENLSLLTD